MKSRSPYLVVVPSAPWRWSQAVLALATLLVWLVLTAMNLWMGELNQDEGWYLYAAKSLRLGLVPYRDFAFTQPPMLPLVYAMVYPWISGLGLLGGRLLTALFGTVALLAAAALAMRLAPFRSRRLAMALCVVLAAVNVYQSYFSSVVKTYSLSSMFLLSGLWSLSFVGRRHAVRPAFLAGFLLSCAAATRLSLALAPALVALYLLVFSRRLKPWAWLDFTLGAVLAAALFVLPFALMGREGFLFGLFEYHTLRETTASPLLQWAYKAGCLARLAQAYFPALLAALAVAAAWLNDLRAARRCPPPPPDLDLELELPDAPSFPSPHASRRLLLFFWFLLLVLSAVHLAAAFPYDDYLVPLYPLFCALLAAAVARVASNHPTIVPSVLLVAALSVSALYAAASPMAHAWFLAGRDRVWWNLRTQSPVAQLRDAAQWVRDLSLSASGTALLTQDAYLAVEADLPLLPGLEMGPFSYYPDFPAPRAAALHVHNRDSLAALLRTETNAPVAALSGYSLSIRSPEILPVDTKDAALFRSILANRFDHVDDIPSFGQASTTLEIWRLKTAGLPPDEAAELEEARLQALDEAAELAAGGPPESLVESDPQPLPLPPDLPPDAPEPPDSEFAPTPEPVETLVPPAPTETLEPPDSLDSPETIAPLS